MGPDIHILEFAEQSLNNPRTWWTLCGDKLYAKWGRFYPELHGDQQFRYLFGWRKVLEDPFLARTTQTRKRHSFKLDSITCMGCILTYFSKQEE